MTSQREQMRLEKIVHQDKEIQWQLEDYLSNIDDACICMYLVDFNYIIDQPNTTPSLCFMKVMKVMKVKINRTVVFYFYPLPAFILLLPLSHRYLLSMSSLYLNLSGYELEVNGLKRQKEKILEMEMHTQIYTLMDIMKANMYKLKCMGRYICKYPSVGKIYIPCQRKHLLIIEDMILVPNIQRLDIPFFIIDH